MTQEEKELLLKDLCARLPYGVIIQEYNEEYGYADNALNTIGIGYFSIHEACIEGTWINHIENVKPYLRPMSSMTEEEKEEIKPLFSKLVDDDDFGRRVLVVRQHKMALYQDWLNAHHFDYRGLIEKSLALEAPEEMYNIKEK